MSRSSRSAFTLIEMVSVMAIIAIFAGVIGYAFMRGAGGTVGLQAAQSSVSSLLTLVRGQAAHSGHNAALFVNVNENNPARYLRYLVPAIWSESDGKWAALSDGLYLPQGIYVVPATPPSGGAIETGADWSEANSTLLAPPVSAAFLSASSEQWSGVVFTPRGTVVPTPAQGNIMVANGRMNPPDSTPPFVFVNPENARGVAVSVYGLTRLIDDPTAL